MKKHLCIHQAAFLTFFLASYSLNTDQIPPRPNPKHPQTECLKVITRDFQWLHATLSHKPYRIMTTLYNRMASRSIFSKKKPRPKKRSTTDQDATMTTSSHTHRMEPFYKQHGAVDDLCGVIVDVSPAVPIC